MKEGFARINFVLRFLAVLALFLIAAASHSMDRSKDDWPLIIALCLPTAAAFTLAWIIDGFAGIKTPSDEMRPWWYWAFAGAVLVFLTAL